MVFIFSIFVICLLIYIAIVSISKEKLKNVCLNLKQNLSEIENDLTEYKTKLENIENLEDKLKNIDLKEMIKNDEKTKASLTNNINKLTEEIEKKNKIIEYLNDEIEFLEFGLYEPKYEFYNSSEYKEKLDEIRNKQKEMIKNKTAAYCTIEWTVNGSKSKGRVQTNNCIKLSLKMFNSDCDLYISKCNYSNVIRMEEKIEKSFEQINKLNEINCVYIDDEYKELKIEELMLAHEYSEKKQEEKEQLRDKKQAEREEAKLKKEIEEKKNKLRKEMEHYNNSISILMCKLKKEQNEENIKKLNSEILELKDKKQDILDEELDLEERLNNIGAGYVYIISNIGSFGENIFKIGVTRRLDPTERIAELSSASVPFKFEINALIFDQNAYKLESYLHNKFAANRINLINNRKEFFNITLEMIEQELKNYGNLAIEFNKNTNSKEYLETLKLREKIKP